MPCFPRFFSEMLLEIDMVETCNFLKPIVHSPIIVAFAYRMVRYFNYEAIIIGGGRVVRRRWVNFQCRGVLRIWIIVEQGPITRAVGIGGDCFDIFLSSILNFLISFTPSRQRLKYCLKGSFNQNNQPIIHNITGLSYFYMGLGYCDNWNNNNKLSSLISKFTI